MKKRLKKRYVLCIVVFQFIECTTLSKSIIYLDAQEDIESEEDEQGKEDKDEEGQGKTTLNEESNSSTKETSDQNEGSMNNKKSKEKGKKVTIYNIR